MVINGQGQFTGNPGYARNATARTSPGFSDLLMVHILPGQGQPTIEERDINSTDTQDITPTDPMCKKTQQQQIQTSGLPRLSAAPGSLVALRYQENGHVSLPQNQPGKPPNRGTVYIYGTTQPKAEENFLDVFNQWNADGTGGDKRGKLLETQPFDDGHCYQMNSGSISTQRQQQYPHAADKLMGADLWCQNDIKIPTDTVSGKPYTLYWVWDWPTEPGVDPNLPKGKAEIYTTCMDVDINGAASKRGFVEARALQPQASGDAAINSQAIPSYMSSLTASNQATPASTSAPAPSMPAVAVSTHALSSALPALVTAVASPSASPLASTYQAAMNAAAAASIVEAAIDSEISSMLAADTLAATLPVSTVTVTVGAQSQAAQPQAPQSSPAASSPHSQHSSTTSPSSSPPSVPGNPPSSMNIQSPIISALSGIATAVTAVPSSDSALPSSSVVAGAGASTAVVAQQDTFSGTATPVASSAASTATGGCANAKCRAVKRSRILGHV